MNSLLIYGNQWHLDKLRQIISDYIITGSACRYTTWALTARLIIKIAYNLDFRHSS